MITISEICYHEQQSTHMNVGSLSLLQGRSEGLDLQCLIVGVKLHVAWPGMVMAAAGVNLRQVRRVPVLSAHWTALNELSDPVGGGVQIRRRS